MENTLFPPKRLAILGSTGSIGVQALDVVAKNPEHFSVEVLTAGNNADLLIAQAVTHQPNVVVIANEHLYDKVQAALDPLGIKVYSGLKAIESVVAMDSVDLVLTALVGYAGLAPTLAAIRAEKPIALANKETLVVAGQIVTDLAREKGVNIYPVDSEHSAIFQCMAGEWQNPIEKIILTASGGPFRGRTRESLQAVTVADALRHPNWSMGAKITIDSATLMNKGLEVIEAKWLFNLAPNQIEVVVHPQSIIHSFVQFRDGSVKAQMGLPDMRIPIQYALTYPHRLPSDVPRYDILKYPNLTFEEPDLKTFRNLALAYKALEMGGNAACIINAANEIAVEAFLAERLSFLEISDLLEEALETIKHTADPSYQDLVDSDTETRRWAREWID